MAKTATRLTEGNYVSGGTTTNTASISPAASSAIVVAIFAYDTTTMSVSGAGLTWTERIAGQPTIDGGRIWVFVAAGASPSAGALTLTFDDGAFVNWAVDNITGTVSLSDPSTLNITHATNTGTAVAATIAPFSNSANAAWCYGYIIDDVTVTQGSGYTLVDTNKGSAMFGHTDFSQFQDGEDTSPDATLSSSAGWGFVAIEIRDAGSSPASYELTAEQGSYSLTGQQALLLTGGFITAESGSYTLLGSNATRDIEMTASQGSYALTGQAALLIRAARLLADDGLYVFTGQNADLFSSLIASHRHPRHSRRMFGFRLNR